ncbi:MAG: class F sortase [bacterium]|nr:class F sortase [bacterium]
MKTLPLVEAKSISPTHRSAELPESLEAFGLPVFIQIPSINVNAEIERVALAEDGSMDVPKHAFSTAWYELGPRPGEIGSAAIAGHVNWMDGSTAIFANLHKVKAGDKIIVQNDTGKDISFVVREIRNYESAQDATDVFTSHDGKAHLNIITCSGVWDKESKQYSKRLVVFAERE